VVALAASVSPASAAISGGASQAAANPLAVNWPGAGSLLAALALVAVTWGASLTLAARRDRWTAGAD